MFYRLVEKSLGRFVDDKKAQQLRDKSLPLEGCAVVAGRTDKGVTALQQVCSFCQFQAIQSLILFKYSSCYDRMIVVLTGLRLYHTV